MGAKWKNGSILLILMAEGYSQASGDVWHTGRYKSLFKSWTQKSFPNKYWIRRLFAQRDGAQMGEFC